MPQCCVNDVPLPLLPGLQTWGDLLAEVERGAGDGRQVVTAARFDGVDHPSFREPEPLRQPLSAYHGIAVETVDAGELLRETVAMARESLPVLAASVCEAGQAFRGQQIERGVRELPLLVDAVRTLLQLTDAAGRASGFALEEAENGEQGSGPALMRIAAALGRLSAAHEAEDWIAMADGLEFELAPALSGWRMVLDSIPVRRAA